MNHHICFQVEKPLTRTNILPLNSGREMDPGPILPSLLMIFSSPFPTTSK